MTRVLGKSSRLTFRNSSGTLITTSFGHWNPLSSSYRGFEIDEAEIKNTSLFFVKDSLKGKVSLGDFVWTTTTQSFLITGLKDFGDHTEFVGLQSSTTLMDASLVLWLKPETLDDLGLSDGDEVTLWADSSGKSNDFSGASGSTALYRPSSLDGYGAIECNGSSRWMTRGDTLGIMDGEARSFFVVAKSDDVSVYRALFCQEDPSSRKGIHIGSTVDGASASTWGCQVWDERFEGAVASAANYHLFALIVDDMTAGETILPTVTQELDTVPMSLSGVGGGPNHVAMSATDSHLGKGERQSDGSDRVWDGRIVEVMVYKGQITESQKLIVKNHFSNKYSSLSL